MDWKTYVNTKLAQYVKENGYRIDDQGREFINKRKEILKEYHNLYGVNSIDTSGDTTRDTL